MGTGERRSTRSSKASAACKITSGKVSGARLKISSPTSVRTQSSIASANVSVWHASTGVHFKQATNLSFATEEAISPLIAVDEDQNENNDDVAMDLPSLVYDIDNDKIHHHRIPGPKKPPVN